MEHFKILMLIIAVGLFSGCLTMEGSGAGVFTDLGRDCGKVIGAICGNPQGGADIGGDIFSGLAGTDSHRRHNNFKNRRAAGF